MPEHTDLPRHNEPVDATESDGGDPPPANRAERRAKRRNKQDATPQYGAAAPQRLHGRGAVGASRQYDRRRSG